MPPGSEPEDRSGLFRRLDREDVYGEGEEPDPRFTLANERTFLAWQRTALALMAAGVGIKALTAHTAERDVVAVVLVLLGLGCAITALLRWGATERAMRTGRPLPRFRAAFPLAVALAAVAALLAAMLFLR
ncbi:YidH family protein [Streptacidiphilus monticola]|uniref:YidH family protein n=1 Tax=Streptacidiphilus monticola TaxID=2161674 RepID=A0ABW1G4L7_9ACTN